jgi:CBS domain-containing protein
MSSPVITVTPETHLNDARHVMSAEKIRVLPIVKSKKLVGIVTRRGLLRADITTLDRNSWNTNIDLKDETVGEIMTANPITIVPTALIPKAARVMLENKITALPVMENGEMVGILTNSDILRFILSEVPLLKKEILVRDYMTDDVVTIDPDTSLLEAHRLMGTKRIRSLPVMTGDQLVGLVTRTDLMSSDPSRFASRNNQELSLKILTQSVNQIMTRQLITISPEQKVVDAARLMLENKIHCLPILDENKRLAGLITESDLFLMVIQKFF